jgi:hypothetical protein
MARPEDIIILSLLGDLAFAITESVAATLVLRQEILALSTALLDFKSNPASIVDPASIFEASELATHIDNAHETLSEINQRLKALIELLEKDG